MRNKELIREDFYKYVKQLCEKKSLKKEFKEFERLFTVEKDYKLAFIYYTKIIRKGAEGVINKKLEGDFFAEFIW